MVPLPELGLHSGNQVNFSSWLEALWSESLSNKALSSLTHGHTKKWLSTLNQLPRLNPEFSSFSDVVSIGSTEEFPERNLLENVVDTLKPWRKGPFSLFGLFIDSEWRSNLKWDRIKDQVDLKDKTVLDIGCSNGYFGFRMLESGATSVIGLESSDLFVLQASLINFYLRSSNVVVPHRFGVDTFDRAFDVVFSMGVSYHQRDLFAHVSQTYETLSTPGQLILETLIADEDIVPTDRYANMRNVWLVPCLQTILDNLDRAGFRDHKVLDTSVTTTFEQRSTKYTYGGSLAAALNPATKRFTIEGYPAPKRAVILTHRY